jgi:putative transcriptional regulator
MKPELRDRLPELALGTLPDAERDALRAEVAASPELQRELELLTEALARTAEALPPLAPSPAARARLLESLSGPDRFRPFFAELARRFDLTVEAVRGLLARIDHPAAWEGSAVPWVKLIHFEGGPALAGADAGFVRVGAGTRFPRHAHQGRELAFVLEGRMIQGARTFGPGDIDDVGTETVHDYVVGPEADLVVMVWHHGITLTGD